MRRSSSNEGEASLQAVQASDESGQQHVVGVSADGITTISASDPRIADLAYYVSGASTLNTSAMNVATSGLGTTTITLPASAANWTQADLEQAAAIGG